MLTSRLQLPAGALVLGLSAHPDDLEIGCGGTLLRLVEDVEDVRVVSVVASGDPHRLDEARAALAAFTDGRGELVPLGLRDGHVAAEEGELKDRLRSAVGELRPDLVLAPAGQDAHQDHRAVSRTAWQVLRGTLVLEYEIAKWEGDLDRRNAYVALRPEHVARKLALLSEHYPSQAARPWFDDEAFRGLLRLRGTECGARYAEAFTARKLLLEL